MLLDAEALERLLDDLSRPIWVWRSARGFLNTPWTIGLEGRRRGAETRRINALESAHEKIMAYADAHR